MTYIFVFVGEFGYELLNWQGVVRKFVRTHPKAHVICASRANVAALYEGTRYVEIGDVPAFKESVASGYSAVADADEPPSSEANARFDETLRGELRAAILAKLREELGWKALALRVLRPHWVFSSSRTVIDDCTFGADPRLFGNVRAEGNIYDLLDLANNFYVKIEPDMSARRQLEARGVRFDRPFVLVQSRRRAIRQRSEARVAEEPLLKALADRVPVVLAEFNTGRAHDSFSSFAAGPGLQTVAISNFADQSCLVAAAGACVFTTEGDFGSHMYVPPLLGRDVLAVAPRDVFELGTTPIAHWNDHVFRFGGQIVPAVAEDLEQPGALERFVDDVDRRLAG